MALTVAVDIGGTFTDLLGYDAATGRLFSAKTSSTPGDLSIGIRRCLEKSGVAVRDIGIFVHGSTVAINTVIERKGARTALVVTRGTRDVYKIGRGNRPDAYDLFFKRPEPLVPRHLTFEVEERMSATGLPWLAFDHESGEAVALEIAASGVDAVAVCFLHSWSNPAHEAAMGVLLTAAVPDAYSTLSHEILREYGEYERTSTTVLNAYIGPRVVAYLGSLQHLLDEELGFAGQLLIMQSNGGVMPPATARRMPVAMLESGPVGGFIAAARVGGRLGYHNVISLDMGGTTAKTNVVKDDEPQMAHGYFIGGYASGHAMMLPVVDTVEIQSGGGSIAWVNEVGALEVGPLSAGAEPGPVCYGKGGTEPTITDANLVLGRLDPAGFLGGEMALDVEAARAAVRARVADPFGLTDVEAALAIVRIAVLKMSLAVRQVSVERGDDPRDFALVVFGGAGPLHGVEVARELHIPTVIVPNVPGQFSAAGMLMADIRHDYVRTFYGPLDDVDLDELRRVAAGLQEIGRQRLGDEQVPDSRMRFQCFLELRYAGQDFAIPVPVALDNLAPGRLGAIRRAFAGAHERQFGHHDADQPLEVVNVRLAATGASERRHLPDIAPASGSDPIIGVRPAIFFYSGRSWVECRVYRRETLRAGLTLSGPAIIQEYASTTVLFPGDAAVVTPTGELLIDVGPGLEAG